MMMARETPPDLKVEGWLKTLGIESLCQWDVLFFLYHHQTSLAGAEFIAHLLGCATEPVVAVFDHLESLGLVARSRVSQNVRVYQFIAPSAPQRGDALEQLVALASSRAGRVVLSKILRAGNRTPQEGLEAAQRFLEQAK
jgi:DNA-binding MarR family transcriptional regulator